MKSEERPNAWKQIGHLLCVSLKYNIMIREYETFFKHFTENKFKKDIDIFNETMEAVDPFHLKCPNCKANGKCRQFSEYSRMMVSFEENAVITHHLTIFRVKCDSCKHTHAILPSILIPHSIYSLVFILTVLRTYFQKQLQIQQICELYEITHSTLYSWIGMLKRHKTLWLGILKDLETTVLDFICELFDLERLEQYLNKFFISNARSFLQKATVCDSA
jgi:hypothetical protein